MLIRLAVKVSERATEKGRNTAVLPILRVSGLVPRHGRDQAFGLLALLGQGGEEFNEGPSIRDPAEQILG